MKNYQDYLQKTGEVGYVKKIYSSIAYVEGLPNLHLKETVYFENGGFGMVFSIGQDLAEILLLSDSKIIVGESVARTNEYTSANLGEYLIGSVLDSLGKVINTTNTIKVEKTEVIDKDPKGILGRKEIDSTFNTGVKIVDMVVPLGKGQRELIIGERKTGKTLFLMQSLVNQAKNGYVCIYAGIGKRQQDIDEFLSYILEEGISKSIITIISGAAETPGKVYMTPYTAMTIAEYFRDQGKDVFVILDDLTTHASYYRELSLEAKRFPGRSSYPGDIFYAHARLLERAGNFETGSITCFPLAENVLGDLSGYIQTNLMSMTDGHIYFDIDRYNQGIRPSVNPFLSVTRVGLQVQSPLLKDASRQISSFLVQLESLKDLLHFGAEAGQQLKETIALGEKISVIFQQDTRETFPVNLTLYLVALVWSGFSKDEPLSRFEDKYAQITDKYSKDNGFKELVDKTILGTPSFSDLVSKLKQNNFYES